MILFSGMARILITGLKYSCNDYKAFLNRSYSDIIREHEEFVGV